MKSATVLLKSFFPSLIGSQPGRTMDMRLVVVLDLGLEQFIGVGVTLYFLKGKQTHQALLQSAEESLDFAFGLG